MRRLTGGQKEVDVPGRTLKDVINGLEQLFPGMYSEVVEEDDLVPGLAAVIDGEHTVEGLLARLKEDTEIHFLPAIAGGS